MYKFHCLNNISPIGLKNFTSKYEQVDDINEAQGILVVARAADAKTGNLKPCLFVVPTDAPGLEKQVIDMTFDAPEKQFTLFFDDVRLPADALVGDEDAGLLQLFAGLNPERIMGAAYSNGMSRFALSKAVEYAKTRSVWRDKPIGTHQGIAHPLAKIKIELEQSKLLQQKTGGKGAQGGLMAKLEALQKEQERLQKERMERMNKQ